MDDDWGYPLSIASENRSGAIAPSWLGSIHDRNPAEYVKLCTRLCIYIYYIIYICRCTYVYAYGCVFVSVSAYVYVYVNEMTLIYINLYCTNRTHPKYQKSSPKAKSLDRAPVLVPGAAGFRALEGGVGHLAPQSGQGLGVSFGGFNDG